MQGISEAGNLAIDVAPLQIDSPKAHPDLSPATPLSLRRNAVWIIAGNGLYAASQWTQVAIIARLGTSLDVGRYALAMGLCAPVFMLANLQLRSIQATDAVRKYAFGEYLGLRLATSSGALLVLLILASFSTGSFQLALFIVMIALYKAIESVSDIYQGLLQQRERMDCVGRSFMLKGLLVVSAFGAAYYCTRSLLWGALGMAVAQLLSLMFYDMRAAHWAVHGSRRSGFRPLFQQFERPRWRSIATRRLALRALPLGVTMMLISLYVNLPRFALDKYIGAAAVGIFAAIAYLSNIGSLIVYALGTAACPRLSRYACQHDRRAFRSLLTKLILFAAGIGIIGIAASVLFGRNLLHLLYGEEYARHNDVLLWSMIAAALGYITSTLGYAATAMGRFAGQPWALAAAVIVLLGSAVVLVPAHGIVGGAMATVLASITCLCSYTALIGWRRHDES